MGAATHRKGPLILVTDGWLGNVGDAASYLATTRSLRRALPGARVAIASHHREVVGHLYPELDLAPPLDSLAGVSWPWSSPADAADRDVAERLVESADLVLAAGGGYLLETYKPEGRIRVYEELLARGKRMMFYAQSIGRFEDAGLRKRLQAVLAAAELILVRDEPSLETVRSQRPGEGVHLTADEAFLFPRARRLSRPRSLFATISLHPWVRNRGGDELRESSLAGLAKSLTRLLSSGAVRRITMASTAQGFAGTGYPLEDDSLAAEVVRAAIPAHLRDRVDLRRDYLRPDAFVELAAQHTAAVSMRMHGAILAALGGTPVLFANASDKARSLSMRTNGAIRGIAGLDALDRVDELLAPLLEDPQGALRSQNEGVEQMRALARTNAELVAGAMS